MHAPVLIPDSTLFIQLALFLVCFIVLKYVLFKPYLKLLDERFHKTEGAIQQSEKNSLEALQYEKNYFEELKSKATEVYKILDDKKIEIHQKEEAFIDQLKVTHSKNEETFIQTTGEQSKKIIASSIQNEAKSVNEIVTKILDTNPKKRTIV